MPEIITILHSETQEGKRLFELLRAAYIQARYNSKFIVNKEDIESLTPIINQLKDATEQICQKRFDWYAQQSKLKNDAEPFWI